MKATKLKLNDLMLNSFVTIFNISAAQTIVGGNLVIPPSNTASIDYVGTNCVEYGDSAGCPHQPTPSVQILFFPHAMEVAVNVGN